MSALTDHPGEGLAGLFPEGTSGRVLPASLPPGRLVRDHGGGPAEQTLAPCEGALDTGSPLLWLSDGPPPEGLWERLYADREPSGLWPLLLEGLYGDDGFRPWGSGELTRKWITSPGLHDPAALLARWWVEHACDCHPTTAPFGTSWPGLAPRPALTADPDAQAITWARILLHRGPFWRLGLVAAGRGADALAAAGWMGPCNYDNDTAMYSAVVRDWEDRYGARVIGVGFASLYLSVAAPPATLDEALRAGAEHFAFCPDTLWPQSPWQPDNLPEYAKELVGATSWKFWWD